LLTFRVARLIYDVTVRFCERFVPRGSRTHDQMVQAARSGVQNIAEGSKAAGTSARSELKLTGVARASLEELRLDYEDFLRHRGRSPWERDDGRAGRLIESRPSTIDDFGAWIKRVRHETSPHDVAVWEIAANGSIVLIRVTSALLARQIAAQLASFEREGGFSERLHRARTRSSSWHPSAASRRA